MTSFRWPNIEKQYPIVEQYTNANMLYNEYIEIGVHILIYEQLLFLITKFRHGLLRGIGLWWFGFDFFGFPYMRDMSNVHYMYSYVACLENEI